MAKHKKKLSFHLPIKEEDAIKAIRLMDACKTALDHPDCPFDVNAIYENPQIVPSDLVEQVNRIDPCQLGDPGIIVSYEKTGNLWIRHDQSANLGFLMRYLGEVLNGSDLESRGFEYSDDCSEPYVGAFGGGVMFITKHQAAHFSTYEMLCMLERMVNEQRDSALPGLDPQKQTKQEGASQGGDVRKKLH